ncbi:MULTISPECIES: hypothetical protein [Streptomycetaceae]|uniref:HK97 gp10 family phage protein n=1 Tax=Streptantibioticus cattleyicolor (strain ATCC 35852 / DSM 46488 / JCM 4925 / NBRC 14057 / NRRL 8057) TaxID=1003195 RepID=F8JXB9_STREN|nr:hypothetical protein [Streptantibioticus cattleyicolor]AEW94592.1 hypothetical protein SCATT_22210 [Streptantibioticus cattleyicolor NRRL 8057 = DSM 46488]MYS59230.1 hypothetical protein [Streptomyces sp. SID5468]CCB74949.1 protein of unknown function [Streptantibioticus cattleyicolor NRRL 8057 = DSM 46488]
MGDVEVRIEGWREVQAALDRMSRDVDTATVAALKASQNLAKKMIRSGMRGRPRWDHRGRSARTGESVSLNLNPPHVTKSGGPGRLTGKLSKGVGGVRKPKRTAEGYQGGVGVGGGVRNLYKKRAEGRYPYVAPGIKKAEPRMPEMWEAAWGRATKT